MSAELAASLAVNAFALIACAFTVRLLWNQDDQLSRLRRNYNAMARAGQALRRDHAQLQHAHDALEAEAAQLYGQLAHPYDDDDEDEQLFDEPDMEEV